ncbi:MAG: hypothetical protein RB191_04950 [Terriglobia bacterium]|nr:hypothetical protein [Terriglobia bacterium]
MTQAFDELRSRISTLLQEYGDSPHQLTQLAVFLETVAQDAKAQASVTAARTSAAKRENQEIESFRLSSKMCRMLLDGVSVQEIAHLHQKSTTAVTQRVRTLGYKLYYRLERSGLGISKEPFSYATTYGIRDSAAEWKLVLDLLDKEIELRAKGQPFWQEVWKAPAWNESSEHSTDPVE